MRSPHRTSPSRPSASGSTRWRSAAPATAPTVVFVDGTGPGPPRVDWRPAGPLWGLSARAAEDRIRAEHGPDWQVASIGPAGERLIPFATLSHDGRHAGRGGLGAVLGAKRIKAIAVRGDRRTPLADPAATMALARRSSARSFGPATEKYRALGTVANLLTFNRLDTLPTRNFRSGHFEEVERLATEDLAPARRIARTSCAACTIGCEHIYALPKAPAGKHGSGIRLEYESLFALGPLCGNSDPALVLEAAHACDELGLDTISTGGTIAFVMDCVERGWVDGRIGPSGQVLRFGAGAAMLDAIAAIVERQGLGALLALGSRRAAEQIGGSAPDLAPHVKGLELPGYDPRALQTMALGLAVGTRGADHNRSGAYEADFSPRADRHHGDARSALLAIETEDRAAMLDCLILCKFLRGVFTDLAAEAAEMLAAVTGHPYTSADLHAGARRSRVRPQVHQSARGLDGRRGHAPGPLPLRPAGITRRPVPPPLAPRRHDRRLLRSPGVDGRWPHSRSAPQRARTRRPRVRAGPGFLRNGSEVNPWLPEDVGAWGRSPKGRHLHSFLRAWERAG